MQIDLPAVDFGEHCGFGQPSTNRRGNIICRDGVLKLLPAAIGEYDNKHSDAR
jgi:hypothetical protein